MGAAEQIEGEQLQKIFHVQRRVSGQHDFAIPVRVQRVSVVVGVAHCIVMKIPPAEQTIDTYERAIQSSCLKYGAVSQFMHGKAAKKTSNRAVDKQRQDKAGPNLVFE